eukprot:13917_1
MVDIGTAPNDTHIRRQHKNGRPHDPCTFLLIIYEETPQLRKVMAYHQRVADKDAKINSNAAGSKQFQHRRRISAGDSFATIKILFCKEEKAIVPAFYYNLKQKSALYGSNKSALAVIFMIDDTETFTEEV